MQFKQIDLSVFPKEREEQMKKLYRYSLFRPMYYRPNLWQHSHRVSWLVEDMLPAAMKAMEIDPEKARVMGMVHDDAELKTGDLMSSTKAQMSLKEKEEFEKQEIQAGFDLAEEFGVKKVHGYDYAGLLEEMVHRTTPESQLIAFADKLDAYNETMHEIMAGNWQPMIFSIVHTSRNTFGLRFKHPHLMTFIKNAKHPFTELDIFMPETGNRYIEKAFFDKHAVPHTRENLDFESGIFTWYDHWKKIMVSKGDESISWLTDQKES